MPRGKYIDLNNFNGDILEYDIKEYCFDYENSNYSKSELYKPK